MQREILFKAKRNDNGEWIEGNLVYIKCDDKYYIVDFNTNIYNENKFGDIKELDIVEVIPNTISQYTGLKDKTNNKIFEHDIVRVVYDTEENIYQVVYDMYELDFKATNGKEHYGNNFLYLSCTDEIEVIGNIFDEGVNNVNTANKKEMV